MTVTVWVKARAVELGASLGTAAVLLAGLAIGVPFLRERIPETFLYSFCCVGAVVLRAAIDLVVRGTVLALAPSGQPPARRPVWNLWAPDRRPSPN